jgi:hypothetical protein
MLATEEVDSLILERDSHFKAIMWAKSSSVGRSLNLSSLIEARRQLKVHGTLGFVKLKADSVFLNFSIIQ